MHRFGWHIVQEKTGKKIYLTKINQVVNCKGVLVLIVGPTDLKHSLWVRPAMLTLFKWFCRNWVRGSWQSCKCNNKEEPMTRCNIHLETIAVTWIYVDDQPTKDLQPVKAASRWFSSRRSVFWDVSFLLSYFCCSTPPSKQNNLQTYATDCIYVYKNRWVV